MNIRTVFIFEISLFFISPLFATNEVQNSHLGENKRINNPHIVRFVKASQDGSDYKTCCIYHKVTTR